MEIESYNVYVNNCLDAKDLSMTEALNYAKYILQKYANNGDSIDVRITLNWRTCTPNDVEWLWEEDN